MKELVGPYRVQGLLGHGGMGVVYLGVHDHLGREVAVKVLAPELTRHPEFRERFFAEARVQARLQHTNIVTIYDLLEDDGDFFIVMEHVTGATLETLLGQRAGGAWSLNRSLGLFSQILAGLDYAHSKGVIHRDVKPSNVLVAEGDIAKLTDFGIALLVGDKRLTSSRSTIGTPTYMAPEHILRPRSVDHRADVYSAGVVLFEMLAGRPPYDAETEYEIKKLQIEAPVPDLRDLDPALPPAIAEAVRIALAKDPEARFPSAGAFLRALQDVAPSRAEAPVVAASIPSIPEREILSAPYSPGWNEWVSRVARTGHGRWILGIAAALVLGVGLALFLFRPEEPVIEAAATAPAAIPPAPPSESPAIASPTVPDGGRPQAEAVPVALSSPPLPVGGTPRPDRLKESLEDRATEPRKAEAEREPAQGPPPVPDSSEAMPQESPAPPEKPATKASATESLNASSQVRDYAVQLTGYKASKGFVLQLREINAPESVRAGETASFKIRYIVLSPDPQENFVLHLDAAVKDGDLQLFPGIRKSVAAEKGGGMVETSIAVNIPRGTKRGIYFLDVNVSDSAGRQVRSMRAEFEVK